MNNCPAAQDVLINASFMDKIVRPLFESGAHIETSIPMARLTTFEIGGPADAVLYAKNTAEVQLAIRLCRENNMPFMLLGNGSNMLVRDGGIAGLVISMRGLSAMSLSGHEIHAGAGVLLKYINEFAQSASLAGLEFASGIPGSLGGALYMNAGAYGGEMGHVAARLEVLTRDGDIRWLDAGTLCFAYRHSCVMEKNHIVLGAALALSPDNAADIARRTQELSEQRRQKQPKEPSGGSFFKRPPGHYASKLIQDAGLKGLGVGGAMVSEKHAGFIINRGGATAADVLALMALVQEKVQAAFGVTLEPEVRIIGHDA